MKETFSEIQSLLQVLQEDKAYQRAVETAAAEIIDTLKKGNRYCGAATAGPPRSASIYRRSLWRACAANARPLPLWR